MRRRHALLDGKPALAQGEPERRALLQRGPSVFRQALAIDVLAKQNEQDGKEVVLMIPTTPELEKLLSVREIVWPCGDTVEEVAEQVGSIRRR